jgi:hypothetical protein
MHVAVEQPGQDGAVGAVDDLVRVQTGTDLDDATVGDEYVGPRGAAPVPSNTPPPANRVRVTSTLQG